MKIRGVLVLILTFFSNFLQGAVCRTDLLKLVSGGEPLEKILWIDIETGGRGQGQPILEIAAAAVDGNLQIVDRYHTLVFQLPEVLDAMEPEARAMHEANGLLEELKQGAKYKNQIEKELLAFLEKNFGAAPTIFIGGNSVNFDLGFLRRDFFSLSKKLNYRVLDVSSFRLAAQLVYGVKAEKPYGHRAAQDVELSVRELATYFDLFAKGPVFKQNEDPLNWDPDGFL